jgi:hypothetical protein
MDSLKIIVFDDTFRPVLQLINEHRVPYTMQMQHTAPAPGTAATMEIARAVLDNKEGLAALASITIAFVTRRPQRKAVVTMPDGRAVHLEGDSVSQVGEVLRTAHSVTLIQAPTEVSPLAP